MFFNLKEKESFTLYCTSIQRRLRRNRQSPAIRSLLQENFLRKTDFIAPLFVQEGEKTKTAIPFFPDTYIYSVDLLIKKAEDLHKKGIQAIALFPRVASSLKTEKGEEALNPKGLIPKCIEILKKELPNLLLIVDIALDPYTSHGQDGVLDEKGEVDNDETIFLLAKMALLYAEKGADIVAPSDMMDGRIGYIRKKLDEKGYQKTSLLSYSIKYASCLYSPFRSAVQAKIQKDKKSYQLPYANTRESLLEATEDEKEGADILLVKPASFYLDIISELRKRTLLPIAAYQVSGEYAMLKKACEENIAPYPEIFLEATMAIKRAGANLIFSYAAEELLPFID